MNNKKNSVACVGSGFVGGSLSTVLAEKGLQVFNYDKAGKRPTGDIDPTVFESIEKMVEHCEGLPGFSGVYFVCVPTPMYDDGEADLSIVEGVLAQLAAVPGERIAVVKSTVPPGSTEGWNKKFVGSDLHVVFCPEFLREATALDDMRNQDRIILGGPRPWINKVKQLFQSAFPNVPIVKTSSTNAELTKYVTNCFLAMKVSFANELYQICQALDGKGLNADYDRVIECATLDKRLGTSHWKVPSFEIDENNKPLFGYALSCFPKDLNALTYLAKTLGVKPTMLEATWKKNLEVRPQKDWEKLVGRAVSKH